MNRITFLIVIFLVLKNDLIAQNFSFFDNIEIGTRLVLIRPVKDIGNVVTMWVPEFNPNKKQSGVIDALVPVLGVQNVPNYLTFEYDIKYFFKAYKRFKIGFGVNYKFRKLEADLYMGGLHRDNTYIPLIYKARSRIHQNYIALNLNFRRTLPKWDGDITFGLEVSTLLNKSRDRNAMYTGALHTVLLDNQRYKMLVFNELTGGELDNFNDENSLYVNFQRRLWKRLFITAQVNKVLDTSSRHVIEYHYTVGNGERISGAYIKDVKFAYSIGLSWRFFKKNKK